MVEQLARFLGVSCDKAQLESLIEHCHQLVDQCCNAEALPVGRGMCPLHRPCLGLPRTFWTNFSLGRSLAGWPVPIEGIVLHESGIVCPFAHVVLATVQRGSSSWGWLRLWTRYVHAEPFPLAQVRCSQRRPKAGLWSQGVLKCRAGH